MVNTKKMENAKKTRTKKGNARRRPTCPNFGLSPRACPSRALLYSLPFTYFLKSVCSLPFIRKRSTANPTDPVMDTCRSTLEAPPVHHRSLCRCRLRRIGPWVFAEGSSMVPPSMVPTAIETTIPAHHVIQLPGVNIIASRDVDPNKTGR